MTDILSDVHMLAITKEDFSSLKERLNLVLRDLIVQQIQLLMIKDTS